MPSRAVIIAGVVVVVLLGAVGGFVAWRKSESYDISVATGKGNSWEREAAITNLYNRLDPERVGPVYVGLLGDADAMVAASAAEHLGWMHFKPALEPLLAALPKQSSSYRGKFVAALGEIGDPRAVEPLLAILDDTRDSAAAREITSALAKLGPGIVPPLLTRLQSPRPEARAAAAAALGWFSRDARTDADRRAMAPAVEALIPLLRDPAIDVRIGAADAMGNIRDPKFLGALIAAVGAHDETVREVQARVISYYGDEALAALPAAFRSTDVFTHMGAAEALDALSNRGDYDISQRSQPFVAGAGSVLDEALTRRDLVAGAGAFGYYIRQGNPDAVKLLRAALEAHGYKRMALSLLNSGQTELQDAAKSWATAHGYTIQSSSGQTDYKWGKR